MTTMIQRIIHRLFYNMNKRVYLDYASTTPLDLRVQKAMSDNRVLRLYSNPSSIYKEGVEAMTFINTARTYVAQALSAHSDEIYFTSSGTEANNLVIQGVISAFERVQLKNTSFIRDESKKDVSDSFRCIPHIITTRIEHPSVLRVIENLAEQNRCTIAYAPVTSAGIVDIKQFRKILNNPETKKRTVLVSVMSANNEIGTIQPIKEIAKEIRHLRSLLAEEKAREGDASPQDEGVNGYVNTNSHVGIYPYLHTDASQYLAYNPINVAKWGVDFVTCDAVKMYGPRGIGFLYARRGTLIDAQTLGGSQERGLRAGTEALSLVAGLKQAVKLVGEFHQKDSEYTKKLTTLCKQHLDKILTKRGVTYRINGDEESRLPNNINICISGFESELLVLRLDAKGVLVSHGASCRNSLENSRSYVIDAINSVDKSNTLEAEEKAMSTDVSSEVSDVSLNSSEISEKNPKLSSVDFSNCAEQSIRITFGRYSHQKDIARLCKALDEALDEQGI
jgi:cysteine desulfurase